MREVLEEQQQALLPAKGFSKANSSDAADLLNQLELTEIEGNHTDPIVVPDGAVDSLAFDYSAYPDEDAGGTSFMKYHQDQLTQQGVSFGRGSFSLYDIRHEQSPWTIRTRKCQLSGTSECCVASHGLSVSSAVNRAFIVYEHKQSEEQKEKYRDTQPGLTLVRSSGASEASRSFCRFINRSLFVVCKRGCSRLGPRVYP